MLKRKRFHPDETYDSMVVSYSSDHAVKKDPVHGNGKFDCALNNVNSITHARKLLPLNVHVPNTYNNVTEGQNTLQFGQTIPEGEFELSAAGNTSTFKFYWSLEVTVTHGGHTDGNRYRLPTFGWKQTGPGLSVHRALSGASNENHITVPDGTYTLGTLSEALDTAINQRITAEYNRTGFGDSYWTTEWLQGGKSPVDPTKDSGWRTMADHAGGAPQRTLQFTYANGIIRAELHNAFATDITTNVDQAGVVNVPNGTWPNRIPHVFGPPFTNPGPWVEWYDLNQVGLAADTLEADKYVFEALDIELTAQQQSLFGHTGDITFGDVVTPITENLPDAILQHDGTSTIVFPAFSTTSFYPQSLSAPITIPPGYYTPVQLSNTIDTLLKATTEPPDFQWLHRIRTYYNGGGQDADVDLPRCEIDAGEFRFYFTPLLAGVVAPSDLVTTYTYLNTYNETTSAPISTVSLVGSSSLLRLLGFADDNVLQLPTDANMTIRQSAAGGCYNMDIPYVHITSPQIARNNVLTSDSLNRNILATVPMTGVARCEYAHFTGADIYINNIEYKGPNSLDRVEFTVTDDKHNQLTIPEHTPVSISLKVYHDDTDP